jgi:hypothetical protein
MKMTAATKVSTVFAIVLFALACPANAMPPIPRTFRGSVERIDVQERKLVVTNQHDRVVLTWRTASRSHLCCLEPGDAVKAYYRKEVRAHVISDLRATGRTCCR